MRRFASVLVLAAALSHGAPTAVTTVLVGTLTEAEAGPTAFSLPPVFTYRLGVRVERSLKGGLEPGTNMVVQFQARQQDPPTLPVGQRCVIEAAELRGIWVAYSVQAATPERVQQAEAAAALLPGWRLREGRPLSPWAELPGAHWTSASSGPRCQTSDRPFLSCNGAQLTIAPKPPERKVQWANPDGDGVYTVTVGNPGDTPIEVPALLSREGRVLWEESLLIFCQDRCYPHPDATGNWADCVPTRLEPGESRSHEVNLLSLNGPEWPTGGGRIEFEFMLGERSKVASFYYLSRHHDPIRAAVR